MIPVRSKDVSICKNNNMWHEIKIYIYDACSLRMCSSLSGLISSWGTISLRAASSFPRGWPWREDREEGSMNRVGRGPRDSIRHAGRIVDQDEWLTGERREDHYVGVRFVAHKLAAAMEVGMAQVYPVSRARHQAIPVEIRQRKEGL